MAKWEEGDPRWIVTDREDGANVNGWHWVDKNRVEWGRRRIDELVKNLSSNADQDLGSVLITGLKTLTGEAYLTQRKGNKKFAVWDLAITLSWEGSWEETSKKVVGEVKISEFASTSDPHEYEYEVSTEDKAAEAQKLRSAVVDLKPRIFELLEQFIAELKES